jgi:Icc-related predicted phosphoesterase
MYKYTHFIKENIAPANAKKIVVYDENGSKVCDIALGRLKQPTQPKQYSFLALSDVHITYETANTDFQRALTYAESNCDFTCICGDLTANGTDSELSQYKSVVDGYAKTKPVYAVGGNHDSIPADMTYSRLTPYTGQPMYYSFSKGNDVFIMLSHYGKYEGGGWLSSKFVSTEELQWLYETLENNRNKRCFIFNHVYPWDDGVGDANRIYDGKNWETQDGGVGQAFISLLKHYKNTTLFCGHSHLRLYLQEIDTKANYSSEVGYRSVHIPSISVPRDMGESGDYTNVYAESEGYVVDVYDDYIILNGRDFIDNDADGHIIPLGTYKIDTTLQTIEANTFTDSTGVITI